MPTKIPLTSRIIPYLHRYFFPLMMFLALNFIKAIALKSNYNLIISCVGIIKLMLLIKIDGLKKGSRYIKRINDSLLLIINLLIIEGLFYEIREDPNQTKDLIFKFIEVLFCEILFIKSFCYKATEMISIVICCFTLVSKYEMHHYYIIYILALLVLICISIISQNWIRKKKNCELCQISTNDLYFSLNEKFQIISTNYNFSIFSKEKKKSQTLFIENLLKNSIFVKKEYSSQPDVKEMISDSLLDVEEGTAIILLDYLKSMQMRKEKSYFCLGKIEISQKNELIYICKRKKRILLKIKRDKAFDEALNLKVLTQNYAKTIYYIAHELRNPLNCIMNLELIDPNEPNSFETLITDFLQPAIISSKLMLNLVNGLLDFAQIEADTFKLLLTRFDLKELMEEVCKIMKKQATNRGTSIELFVDPEIKMLQSDPNRIRQIIINLLSKLNIYNRKKLENSYKGNAIKYTNEGKIRIKAEKLGYSEIRISVADTGLGIDEKNLKKLFHAFSKIQNKEDFCLNAEGVGLGLLISNKLANLLNKKEGGIAVSSKFKHGSEFSFKIRDLKNDDEISVSSSRRASNLGSSPCKLIKETEKALAMKDTMELSSIAFLSHKNMSSFGKDDDSNQIDISRNIFLDIDSRISTSKTSQNSKTPDNMSLIKKRIEKINNKMRKMGCDCPVALIVDDNDFNILSMSTHLKKFGMKCESALSGEIALEKIFKINSSDCCKYFKYIFLDLEMPGKNGVVIYKEITDYYKSVGVSNSKIILNTGYSKSSEIVKEAYAKGVKNILIKPITQMNLVELIDPLSPLEKD